MHFNLLRPISFTIFSPTFFGQHSSILYGGVLTTRIQMWVTVSPSFCNEIIKFWLKLLKQKVQVKYKYTQ